MSAREIPADVLALQIEASDPKASAWVTANAGSGKTYVLAQRVIRLLLEGAPPGKILCLTFTKSAAANMANQVFRTLARWTALDDAQLDGAIAAIERDRPDPERRVRARRLFAEALDTPGGLKVQTIHAFATRLLHQFPFEANVAAQFAVIEERAETELIERVRLTVLLEAAAHPQGRLGKALATAIATTADRTLKEVIDEAMGEREAVARFLDSCGGVDGVARELSRLLGIAPEDDLADCEETLIESEILASSACEEITRALGAGSVNDVQQAQRLAAAAAATGAGRLCAYRSVFLTGGGEPRQRLFSSAFAKQHPALAERLQAEQARVQQLMARRHAIAARDRTAALLTIVDEILRGYQAEKDRRGLIDYDDLIERTLALLTRVEAAWVHFKLDQGIDHVLIDEAQDTSPKQWEIVKRLVAEFTAGAGARGARSVFAVGDEKQSIFSFQGARPFTFAEAQQHFGERHRVVEQSFVACRFAHSFRSGANVLSAVDCVFAAPEMQASISAAGEPVCPHVALPDAQPGVVEVWPLVTAGEKREIDGWDAPFDQVVATSPQARLAQRIAGAARDWLAGGASPGDILILVRQRGPLFEAIIRALKAGGIAVAGADRLVLTEHIAVMDLIALADALLLAADDLALATVLKSPLFGVDEERLFDLAFERESSLRAALRHAGATDPALQTISDELDELAAAARRETPFTFYAQLLGARGGRARILSRLGTEADDALDEFLNLALDYESRETATLQGFIDWLRRTPSEVKRDMDIVRDEVRVMTVHGAKGLEAPIVVLADTTTRPTGPRDPRLLSLPREPTDPDAPDGLVWVGRKETDTALIASARESARRAAEDEYRRLLYVAMTRAARHLVVCGLEGQIRRPQNCWYDLVREALVRPGAVDEVRDTSGEILLWRWHPSAPRSGAGARTDSPADSASTSPRGREKPDWLMKYVPPGAAPVLVSPSTAAEHDGPIGRGDKGRPSEPWTRAAAVAARTAALLRGQIVHRLLQSLPDVEPQRRGEAARRYLDRNGGSLSKVEQDVLVAEVFAVLTEPRFAALFAPGSRAEVPLVGRLTRIAQPPLIVSGQVDRLAVTPKVVLITDYKTDRPAPDRPENVPQAYVTQVSLYRALLRQLYPNHDVRVALIFTERCRLWELSASNLDAALAHLGVTPP